MSPGRLGELRRHYHATVFERVLRVRPGGAPNTRTEAALAASRSAKGIVHEIGLDPADGQIAGQTAGKRFEKVTRDFLRASFHELRHLRPGIWEFEVGKGIEQFAQYRHLADVRDLVSQHHELRTAFGDYIVIPDIVVSRQPVPDGTINASLSFVEGRYLAALTPLRAVNSGSPLLHASISCKWTIRSDRSQNARTEGLNLIRNRKGAAPHVAVVTAEPLPSRIATLALGTGDIDCVYHFALPELEAASAPRESDADTLATLVDGGRLRDISDLPFDLTT